MRRRASTAAAAPAAAGNEAAETSKKRNDDSSSSSSPAAVAAYASILVPAAAGAPRRATPATTPGTTPLLSTRAWPLTAPPRRSPPTRRSRAAAGSAPGTTRPPAPPPRTSPRCTPPPGLRGDGERAGASAARAGGFCGPQPHGLAEYGWRAGGWGWGRGARTLVRGVSTRELYPRLHRGGGAEGHGVAPGRGRQHPRIHGLHRDGGVGVQASHLPGGRAGARRVSDRKRGAVGRRWETRRREEGEKQDNTRLEAAAAGAEPFLELFPGLGGRRIQDAAAPAAGGAGELG